MSSLFDNSVLLDNNMAKLRSKRNISQQQLADAIGVSRKTISTVETGRFTPSVLIALKMALYFEVPVESIFQLEKPE
ncbi:MAG: helix-turn-helix transcriptional regulator [Psychrobium sp.]|nr:helix-turn-helix transcriptional regulator [Psychrobium sp.]